MKLIYFLNHGELDRYGKIESLVQPDEKLFDIEGGRLTFFVDSLGFHIGDMEYRPQARERLTWWKEESVHNFFDWLQEAEGFLAQPLQIQDWEFPDQAKYFFTPFGLLVYFQDQVIARVFLNKAGNLSYVEEMSQQRVERRWIVDQRGFLSACQVMDKKGAWSYTDFFNPFGQRRLRLYPNGTIQVRGLKGLEDSGTSPDSLVGLIGVYLDHLKTTKGFEWIMNQESLFPAPFPIRALPQSLVASIPFPPHEGQSPMEAQVGKIAWWLGRDQDAWDENQASLVLSQLLVSETGGLMVMSEEPLAPSIRSLLENIPEANIEIYESITDRQINNLLQDCLLLVDLNHQSSPSMAKWLASQVPVIFLRDNPYVRHLDQGFQVKEKGEVAKGLEYFLESPIHLTLARLRANQVYQDLVMKTKNDLREWMAHAT